MQVKFFQFFQKIIICKIHSGITLVPEAEFRCILKTVVVHMKSIFMYEKIFCHSGKNTFSQPISAEIDLGGQLRF